MFDIITDSACDLTLDTAKQLQIEVVPFYVSLDGEHYRKEGKEIAVRDFYQFMVDNPSAYPKTSLASIEDFEQAFRAHAAAGRDVLCLVFTSKMSGCVGSARNARDLVLEDFPDARIEVIDSAAATVTESTMVENAVAMRDAGCTLDETVTWLEAEKATNQIFFTVGNLDYLIKGGRIGKVTGRAANMLGIKPMILFKDGEIFSGGVARGRQKSFEKALEQINTEYYIHTFCNEYEAFANWRRTGYPKLTPARNAASYPNNVTNGEIPRRFIYPTSEITANPVNYNDAVKRLSGGDKMTSRVWWDK